jgi:hypothetical protein
MKIFDRYKKENVKEIKDAYIRFVNSQTFEDFKIICEDMAWAKLN